VTATDTVSATDVATEPDAEPDTEPDTATEPDATTIADAVVGPDASVWPWDYAPPTLCDADCSAVGSCDEGLKAACASPRACDVVTCETACLAEVADCEAAAACLGYEGPVLSEFQAGPYGPGTRDLAGPVTLPTLTGTWSVDGAWTGRDSVVVVTTRSGWEYTEQLWTYSPYMWLQYSPRNVHYVFASYPEFEFDDAGQLLLTGDLSEEKMLAQKAKVDPDLDKLGIVYGKAVECHWRRHVHYVPVNVLALGSWVSERVQTIFDAGFLTMGFAIDRFQHVRNLGLLNALGGPPGLNHLGYEAEYFNFEWDREQVLAAEEVLTIELITNESTGGTGVDVELPSAEELLAYDTLEIDLQSWCNNHLEGDPEAGCPEWDTGASLHVVEVPVAADEAPEVEATCEPGKGEDVVAETTPCTCSVPSGGTRESVRTCLEGGAAFGACLCGGSWELARWITTYSREGRWVSDASFFLPFIAGGGTVRMSYSPGNTYITHLSLRLSNRGKADRATSVTRLYGGASFNSTYNDNFEPMTVDIPASAKRAEVVALITGHGFGAEMDNCAEFCNHTHHFTVGEGEVVHDNPWVGNFNGCAQQISDGVVPNQYGTWTLGRGGWCPGLDVKPFVADVTEHVTPGEPVTVSYMGLFEGAPYVPEIDTSPSANGFPGSIWMNSWLVTYE